MAEQSNKIEVNWELKDLDHDAKLLPQFPIENVSTSVGGTLADQPRFGFQDSITNWTRGKLNPISFDTTVYARNEDEGPLVLTWVEDIKALSLPDPDLGRPPICLFTLGSIINEVVLVESVDPTIVSTLQSGYPAEVRFRMVLRPYVPFSQQNIDPTRSAKESFYLIASQAEQSYEGIARRYYGDPMLGDRLRKRHPDYPFAPAVGNVVRVPARSVILKETVEPAAHMLSLENADAVAAFETILEDRTARTLTVVK